MNESISRENLPRKIVQTYLRALVSTYATNTESSLILQWPPKL